MRNQFFFTRTEGDKTFRDSFNMNKVIRFQNCDSGAEIWIECSNMSIFVKETPEQIMELIKGEKVAEVKISNDSDFKRVIDDANIDRRTYNVLKYLYDHKNIKTIEQFLEYYNNDDRNFLKIPNCGWRTLTNIKAFIESLKGKK